MVDHYDFVSLGSLSIPGGASTVTLRIERGGDVLIYSAAFDGGEMEEVAIDPGVVSGDASILLGAGYLVSPPWNAPADRRTLVCDNFLVKGEGVCDFGSGWPGMPVAGIVGLGLLAGAFTICGVGYARKKKQ
jgi:hypothetical protein